jgi:hypothetical protein
MSGKSSVSAEEFARFVSQLRERKHLTFTEACRELNVPPPTAKYWVSHLLPRLQRERPDLDLEVPVMAGPASIAANRPEAAGEVVELRKQVRELKAKLESYDKEYADSKWMKEKLFELKAIEIVQPEWLVRPVKALGSPGVPTLFASDWHWGEVVAPLQINGVNEYNMKIARGRAKAMIERAIDLLNNHMVNPKYPGIVFALGGDMVSGDIHEELVATNEKEIMAVVVDLIGVLVWCIKTLADAFHKVFVPCVTGNHGRVTHKIRAKGRNFTSVDWLIYQMLKMQFEDDERVTFYIPDGADAHYKIFNHRYLLTHGDQFRGGDGVIGMLSPVIRGDHRKRSRNSQIDMEYDTMLMGHWHQLTQLQRLIVNGSLKGYDEYAYNNNFPFEPARQGLWITHPDHGITFTIPVFVDPKRKSIQTEWTSWAKAA